MTAAESVWNFANTWSTQHLVDIAIHYASCCSLAIAMFILEHGVTKYTNLIGLLRGSRITPFSTYET